MKIKSVLALVFAGLAMGGLPLGAATVLIDDTTLNGSFESGSGSVPGAWTTSTGSVTSAELATQRQTSWSKAGGYSAVLGESGSGGVTTLGIDTGYAVQSGDTFNLGFWMLGASGAADGMQVAWTLFTTGTGTIDGTPTVVASGAATVAQATGSPNTSTYNFYSFTGVGSVGAAAVGQELFLTLVPVTSGGGAFSTNGTGSFVRIDEVSLSALPVPEPAAFALAAAGIPLLALMRRRRKAFLAMAGV